MEKEKESVKKCTEQDQLEYFKGKALKRLEKEKRLSFVKLVYYFLG